MHGSALGGRPAGCERGGWRQGGQVGDLGNSTNRSQGQPDQGSGGSRKGHGKGLVGGIS